MDPVRAAVVNALRVHPRLEPQGVGATPAERARLFDELPKIVPFGGRRPTKVYALLDWDHHLPPRGLYLRLHLVYDETSEAVFEDAFTERNAEIARRDLYPEFDVPDWDELPADESYEAELSSDLAFGSMRLVSAWRREIDANVAAEAVACVRASGAFLRVRADEPQRPPHLGDLEPVAWMPPCESGHDAWTIDVWWLTAFDGKIGRGWSFLVDVEAGEPVIAHREFSVRAG